MANGTANARPTHGQQHGQHGQRTATARPAHGHRTATARPGRLATKVLSSTRNENLHLPDSSLQESAPSLDTERLIQFAYSYPPSKSLEQYSNSARTARTTLEQHSNSPNNARTALQQLEQRTHSARTALEQLEQRSNNARTSSPPLEHRSNNARTSPNSLELP